MINLGFDRSGIGRRVIEFPVSFGPTPRNQISMLRNDHFIDRRSHCSLKTYICPNTIVRYCTSPSECIYMKDYLRPHQVIPMNERPRTISCSIFRFPDEALARDRRSRKSPGLEIEQRVHGMPTRSEFTRNTGDGRVSL